MARARYGRDEAVSRGLFLVAALIVHALLLPLTVPSFPSESAQPAMPTLVELVVERADRVPISEPETSGSPAKQRPPIVRAPSFPRPRSAPRSRPEPPAGASTVKIGPAMSLTMRSRLRSLEWLLEGPSRSSQQDCLIAPPARGECGTPSPRGFIPAPGRIEALLRELPVKLRRDTRGNLTYESLTFTAIIASDGALRFEDEANFKPRIDGVGIGATFDLTDALMRARGKDPYGYLKQRFARRTRALRRAMRVAHDRRHFQEGLARLRRQLARLATGDENPVVEVRKHLFELWDECAEMASATENEQLAAHAEMARRIILVYIQQHLPADSAVAFTTDELHRFNERRRSSARFSPYVAIESR